MTVAEKKIKLIQAISMLEDESTLDQLMAHVSGSATVATLPNLPFPVGTNFRFLTVEDINSPEFAYKPVDEKQLVGGWPGDEPIDELLNMLKK